MSEPPIGIAATAELASTPQQAKRPILYVTGMSGAGMSTLLKALEDLGYEAVDNLRPALIPALIAQGAAQGRGLAVGIDSRNAEFNTPELLLQLRQMREQAGLDIALVFLECGDDALLRRFSETRRRHPLAIDRPVIDGIQQERLLLGALREQADVVLDTSLLSLHELRRYAVGQFRLGTQGGLTIFVTSFSFRQGVPREADLVFDARFLANPHWESTLRALTGKDAPVGDYIMQDPAYQPFLDGLLAWLLPLLPRYAQEGKSYLTLAVGCTGGKHRSVFIAERLTAVIAAQSYIVGLHHRDLERGGKIEG
jgi:RNase adapter protein RapZ